MKRLAGASSQNRFAKKRGHERESGEPQGTQPSEYADQDKSGSAKLSNDRCDRHRRGGLQSEMPYFGNSAFEVQDLVDAALQISSAKPEQRDEVNHWRRDDPSSARPKLLTHRFAGHFTFLHRKRPAAEFLLRGAAGFQPLTTRDTLRSVGAGNAGMRTGVERPEPVSPNRTCFLVGNHRRHYGSVVTVGIKMLRAKRVVFHGQRGALTRGRLSGHWWGVVQHGEGGKGSKYPLIHRSAPSIQDQTAQQAQPSAPQKDLRSLIGSLLDHAAA
jgi:hypothetical protein